MTRCGEHPIYDDKTFCLIKAFLDSGFLGRNSHGQLESIEDLHNKNATDVAKWFNVAQEAFNGALQNKSLIKQA